MIRYVAEWPIEDDILICPDCDKVYSLPDESNNTQSENT
jgi:hypothetical protein